MCVPLLMHGAWTVGLAHSGFSVCTSGVMRLVTYVIVAARLYCLDGCSLYARYACFRARAGGACARCPPLALKLRLTLVGKALSVKRLPLTREGKTSVAPHSARADVRRSTAPTSRSTAWPSHPRPTRRYTRGGHQLGEPQRDGKGRRGY